MTAQILEWRQDGPRIVPGWPRECPRMTPGWSQDGPEMADKDGPSLAFLEGAQGAPVSTESARAPPGDPSWHSPSDHARVHTEHPPGKTPGYSLGIPQWTPQGSPGYLPKCTRTKCARSIRNREQKKGFQRIYPHTPLPPCHFPSLLKP